MTHTRLILYISVLAAAFMALSCTKQSLEETYSSQESNIDSFLQTEMENNPGSEIIHNRGSNRLVLVQGDGEQLSATGKATVYYAAYVFERNISTDNLIATNHEETASASDWTTTLPSYDPVVFDLKDGDLVAGLKNGMEGVRAGEECYIVFSGKYGFGNKKHGNVPANSALLYHVWVLEVSE